MQLDAERLVFATDVNHVYERFGQPDATPVERLSLERARDLLSTDALAPGSMAPKVASAVDFVAATGRSANICALQDIHAALAGTAGTAIG